MSESEEREKRRSAKEREGRAGKKEEREEGELTRHNIDILPLEPSLRVLRDLLRVGVPIPNPTKFKRNHQLKTKRNEKRRREGKETNKI